MVCRFNLQFLYCYLFGSFLIVLKLLIKKRNILAGSSGSEFASRLFYLYLSENKVPSKSSTTIFSILLCVFLSNSSHASVIETTAISASTTLGQFSIYSLDQLNDGVISDAAPYNGYASGFGATSGLITLSLDQAYDLTSFSLWNDVNILNEGVRTFSLSFFDSANMNLGSTGVLNAVSQFNAQVYDFGQTYTGVQTVGLNVLTSNLQIEIRELAFNGTATSSVPAPASLALFGAGLIGLLRLTRKRS